VLIDVDAPGSNVRIWDGADSMEDVLQKSVQCIEGQLCKGVVQGRPCTPA
jgi:hypothetical protein